MSYAKLEDRFRRAYHLGGASAMLHWDAATMMPDGANDVRGEQLGVLSALHHQMVTAPEIAEWLDIAETEKHLDEWQRSNLRLMRHRYRHAVCVPEKLVEAFTKLGTESEHVWRTCKNENNFAGFAPYLEKILAMVKEIAAIKAEAFGCSPYEALLDQYDAGRTTAEIDEVFGALENFLPPFVEKVLTSQKTKLPPLAITGPFEIEKQKALGLKLMATLGFDFAHGRLDISAHPFCGGVPGDTRITTRYRSDEFRGSLMGILHETGHALYEMGLPKKWRDQPVGDALGMSLHESQSLFVEMQICRGRPFLRYAAPLIREAFGGKGPAWEAENLYRLGTIVERSFIRVDADEVTYPLHIILRYQLEKELLSGDLKVADLPARWNEKMRNYMGITPPNDTQGCLQDIHWSDGSFGYFPCYTLGAIHAAQFYKAAKKSLPTLENDLEKGHFAPLRDWLREQIHATGSRYTAKELLAKVTGEKLNVRCFQEHLEQRYLG